MWRWAWGGGAVNVGRGQRTGEVRSRRGNVSPTQLLARTDWAWLVPALAVRLSPARPGFDTELHLITPLHLHLHYYFVLTAINTAKRVAHGPSVRDHNLPLSIVPGIVSNHHRLAPIYGHFLNSVANFVFEYQLTSG